MVKTRSGGGKGDAEAVAVELASQRARGGGEGAGAGAGPRGGNAEAPPAQHGGAGPGADKASKKRKAVENPGGGAGAGAGAGGGKPPTAKKSKGSGNSAAAAVKSKNLNSKEEPAAPPSTLEDLSLDPVLKNILRKCDCQVCLDMLVAPHILACGHVFCAPCIFGWLSSPSSNNKCPICRTPLKEREAPPKEKFLSDLIEEELLPLQPPAVQEKHRGRGRKWEQDKAVTFLRVEERQRALRQAELEQRMMGDPMREIQRAEVRLARVLEAREHLDRVRASLPPGARGDPEEEPPAPLPLPAQDNPNPNANPNQAPAPAPAQNQAQNQGEGGNPPNNINGGEGAPVPAVIVGGGADNATVQNRVRDVLRLFSSLQELEGDEELDEAVDELLMETEDVMDCLLDLLGGLGAEQLTQAGVAPHSVARLTEIRAIYGRGVF